MDERDARSHERGSAITQGNPGGVILLGAVALAYGILALITVLLTYAVLARTSQVEAPNLSAQQDGAELWVTFVESAFLAASGVGLARFREWARTLFLALAVVHGAAFVYDAWTLQLGGPVPVVVLTSLRDLLLYGGGALLLTRSRTVQLFQREDWE
jgi:hypothetical protein